MPLSPNHSDNSEQQCPFDYSYLHMLSEKMIFLKNGGIMIKNLIFTPLEAHVIWAPLPELIGMRSHNHLESLMLLSILQQDGHLLDSSNPTIFTKCQDNITTFHSWIEFIQFHRRLKNLSSKLFSNLHFQCPCL